MDQTPTLFEKKGFGGSFTDNIYSNQMNLCALNDNLLINNNEKLYLRPGSRTLYPADTLLTATGYKINRFMKLRDDSQIFVGVGPNLYRDDTANWAILQGPSSGSAFAKGTNSTFWSFSEWKNHLFITNSDVSSKPVKIFKSTAGTWSLVTAGLPTPPSTPNFVAADLLSTALILSAAARTSLLAHYANTSAHPVAHTAATALITSGTAYDLESLKTLVTQLLLSYQLHSTDVTKTGGNHYRVIANVDAAGVTAVRGAEADYTLNSVQAPQTLLECVFRLNDLKSKVETHFQSYGAHSSLTSELASVFYNANSIAGKSEGPGIFLNSNTINQYAFNIRTKYNAHIARVDTVLAYDYFTHNVAADATNVVSSVTETRDLVIDIYTQFNKHQYDAEATNAAAALYHIANFNAANYRTTILDSTYLGIAANDFAVRSDVSLATSTTNYARLVTLLNDVKNKYNGHLADGIFPPNTLKPHGTTSTGTRTNDFITGNDLSLADYVYAFCFKYTYLVNGDTFIDRSPFQIVVPNVGVIGLITDVDEVRVSSVVSISYEGLSITNIPVLTNATGDNYATAQIKVEIYRTIDNGTVLYYVDEVTNGTTNYTDRVTDTELQTRDRAYITGGVVDNDPPPMAKCIHIVNDKAYYGNLVDGLEYLPNQIRESLSGDPDSVPADFSATFEDEVKAISSLKSIPIVFCNTSHFRLEGGFDELGRGALVPVIISETIGCLSEASVVRTEFGVFFAGTDGFYVTDGYQVTKLSKDWNKTYLAWTKTFTQKSNIVGAYDPHQLRVWWGITTDSSLSQNDKAVVLDLNYPLAPTPTWSTVSGGDQFSPTDLTFYNRTLYRGDPDGYVFTHQDGFTHTDPYKDTTKSAALWGDKPLFWDYRSCFMDFSTAILRKWATYFHTQVVSDSNFYSLPQIKNESDASDWANLSALEDLTDVYWSQPDLVWGDATLKWNQAYRGFLAQKRAFPAGALRFTYRQLRLSSQFKLQQTFTAGQTVAINSTTKVVTLTGGTWYDIYVGWSIAFSTDSFTATYEIVRKTGSTTLVVSDPGNVLTTLSGLTYKIYGYNKANSFNLLDYQITGSPLDKTQEGSR